MTPVLTYRMLGRQGRSPRKIGLNVDRNETGEEDLAAPVHAGHVPPSERLRDPALLVIDMQNDFVRRDAPLEVPDSRATIGPIQRLIEAFRTCDRPVIYTRFLSREEPNLLWHWSPQCWPDVKSCWKGHQRTYPDIQGARDCSDVIDELKPMDGEIVIDKYGYGAFHGTDLDRRLKAEAVKSLLVAGTVTQICIEETAREAFHHGYRTTIVADAVSSYAPDLHAATLKNFAMKFGWVADTDTALSWL